jgi:hypothetical protein
MSALQVYGGHDQTGRWMPSLPDLLRDEDLGGNWRTVEVRRVRAPAILGLSGEGSLLTKALLEALTQQATTALAGWRKYAGITKVELPQQEVVETEAQRLGHHLRRISGLTNEEIAPLLGISRRSFQTWLAGGAISARKETRLRGVVETIERLAAGDAAKTRSRLLTREKFSVRPYDLLAEGRFEAAIDLATGRRRGLMRKRPAHVESLAEQLDRDQSNIPNAGGRLNWELSKPIRR